MKLSDENCEVSSIDHLGIVAGIIKELKLSSRIDTLLENKKKQQKVTMGQRVSAMVINGLGFSSRALSMTPHFFSTKPTEDLIEQGVKAEHLNDDALGRVLDCIAEYGVTKFYTTLALDIGIEHNLIGKTARLDSTTFVFHGDYELDLPKAAEDIFPKLDPLNKPAVAVAPEQSSGFGVSTEDSKDILGLFSGNENNPLSAAFREPNYEPNVIENIINENDVVIQKNIDSKNDVVKNKTEIVFSEENLEVIKLAYGYSKDHRPDLKQATFSIATTGTGSYPFWCEPQNGNSSDKSAFQESIKKYNAFKEQMQSAPNFTWVADSALYNKDKLLVNPSGIFKWITRVPESIKEAKNLVKTKVEELNFIDIGNGYLMHNFISNYGNVEQRWLLIFSKQAAYREIETLERKIEKSLKIHEKSISSLSKKNFESLKNAEEAAKKLIEKLVYFTGKYEIDSVQKKKRKEKGSKEVAEVVTFYKVIFTIQKNEKMINDEKTTKGRFILATNQLNKEELSDIQIFEEYKSLQNTERGFRFFKDPWFLAKQFFLKTPSRIAALMSIMSLSLLVYTAAEMKIRTVLKKEKETIPNQNKVPIQNPTLRFIFQLFSCVTKITIKINSKIGELKMNYSNHIYIKLTDVQRKIIRLFGGEVEKIYFSDG